MNKRHLAALLMGTTLVLAGCDAKDRVETREGFAGLADQAVSEIRDELATENLQVGGGTRNLPRAEISPKGELFIGGEKVELDARQQALALQYRSNLAGVAEAGAQVGLEGAALAGTALTEAAKGVLSGNTDQIESRIEAEAESIRVSAQKLCDQLPGLYASEQALKAAVPEFAPYAGMEERDINDCDHEIKTP